VPVSAEASSDCKFRSTLQAKDFERSQVYEPTPSLVVSFAVRSVHSSNPVPSSNRDDGSGVGITAPAGSNDATVATPPPITDTFPAAKEVASVLITRTLDDCPGEFLSHRSEGN
jgi:hypothetical protein